MPTPDGASALGLVLRHSPSCSSSGYHVLTWHMSKAEGWASFFAHLSSVRMLLGRAGHIPRGPVNLPCVPCLCLGYKHSWESERAAFFFLCEEDSKAKEKLREMWQLERGAVVSASGAWLSKPLYLLVPFSFTWEHSPYGRCRQIPAEPLLPATTAVCKPPAPISYQAFFLTHHLDF